MPEKTSVGDPAEMSWQLRLLPVIVRMIVGLTIFFLIASMFQLGVLEWRIQDSPKFDTVAAMAAIDKVAIDGTANIHRAELKASLLLEAHVLERRYHQGMILLMERTWIRYLGFVTGVILCMVGAIFVLGKLREREASLVAKSEPIELTLKTTSPGVLMTAFGTLLLVVTIVTHHEIAVTDQAVFLAPDGLATDQGNKSLPTQGSPLDNPWGQKSDTDGG